MATKNQCQRVLEYMQKHGSITSFEATLKLGITQLGARLGELEEMGFPIDRSEWKEIPQEDGPPKRVKNYKLDIPDGGLQNSLFGDASPPPGSTQPV